MKYFTEWFAKCEEKNRSKFEFYYGPYTKENEDMLENLRRDKNTPDKSSDVMSSIDK